MIIPRAMVRTIEEFRAFVAATNWTYAKTMPRWPHEYVMRKAANAAEFDEAARLIHSHGFEVRLRTKSQDYLDVDGWCYWAMGDPGGLDDIINRTRPETRAAFHAMVNGEDRQGTGAEGSGRQP